MMARKTNGNGVHAADVPAAVVLECYGRSEQDGLIYRMCEKWELDRQQAERRLALQGGTDTFPGLYLGDVRLPATIWPATLSSSSASLRRSAAPPMTIDVEVAA